VRPDWLNNLPPDWTSVPFGSIFEQSKRKNSRLQRDFVLSVLKDRGVIPYTEKGNVGNKVSDDLSGYKLVDKGDFVLNSMNLYMGSVGVSDYDGVTSTAYIVCKPSESVYAGYYKYLIHFKGFQEYVGLLGKGIMEIREAVRWTALKSVFVPLPNLATQCRIADFLDRETARIDLLIEKKQSFINVLAQKWAATVTFTLTNGLNSDAPKKDSGVSWIGEIPEHWHVAKLGHIGRSANGINIGGDAFGSGFPFVSYGDVYRNPELPRTVEGLVQSSAEDRARYTLKAGDVLFTRTSETIDEIGFSSVCMEGMSDTVFAGFLIRFRPMNGKLVPSFSKFLFRNERLRAFFSKEMMIVTRASLSQGLLQRMPVVLPPIEEQHEIAQYLQRSEDTFVSVSETTKTSINRLKEYRSALITAAVTGQIDVEAHARSGATDRRLHAIQEELGA
jgi:type I restriction enzyme S subunit